MAYSNMYGASALSSGGESSYIPNLPILSGLSTVIHFRMGQSNETSHTENSYTQTTGGRLLSGVVSPTPQRNAMGYAQLKMEEEGIEFVWTKRAIGQTNLVQYTPGGDEYGDMVARANELITEFGRIDLVSMFIGESDAGDSTSTGDYIVYINDFIDGLPFTPKGFLAIGPLNMNDVPNAQEEAIRDAYRAVAANRNDFYYVSLDTILDDFAINNHHIELEATADAASDLIKATLMTMF